MEANFHLVQSTTVPLTRTLAEQMRDMKPSPTERVLDPNRVKYLKERAEAHALVPFQWAKARINGDWLRMNGQHSSAMLCALDDDLFPKDLFVHLDEYRVDDEDGLTKLFQQFDARKSSRSSTDVCGAYKGLHEELREIPLNIAQLGIQGIVYWKQNVQGIPQPKGDLIYQAIGEKENWPFLLWLPDVFNIKTPELRKREIVAAMYVTFERNEQAAKAFWKEVQAGGNVNEENHPTRTIDVYYQNAKTETDRRKRPKPHALYQSGILAWNAYREGKKLQTIKALKSDPEPID